MTHVLAELRAAEDANSLADLTVRVLAAPTLLDLTAGLSACARRLPPRHVYLPIVRHRRRRSRQAQGALALRRDRRQNEEGLPIRTYAWVDRIPSGLTVLVEHDTRQMHEPLVIDNADGGRTVFLDTGAAKGGRLSTPSDLGTGTTAEIEEERRYSTWP